MAFTKSAKFYQFQKFQLDNLVDFEKCCKTRIIGADTAENERNFAENLPTIGNYPTGPLPCGMGILPRRDSTCELSVRPAHAAQPAETRGERPA